MNRTALLHKEVMILLDNHLIWIGNLNDKRTLRDYRLNPYFANSMEEVANSIVKLALEYNGEEL
jgi:hypothetical protein|tara:strand:+ start:394 stop:585 length:192 start_codon:yes stop_codon:yes gene_type:complete